MRPNRMCENSLITILSSLLQTPMKGIPVITMPEQL